MNDDLHPPDFDLGEFRHIVARYVKFLIRARWKTDAGFLADSDLTRWELNDIQQDTQQAWRLLEMAATTLATLNTEFIPRCGSGGVRVNDDDTPVSRLVESVAFLVDPEGGGPAHNQSLIEAAKVLQRGESVDWETIADWKSISAIRDDLDLLPQPKRRREKKTQELKVTAKFPSPPGLTWEKVTITFVSNDSARVSACGTCKTYTFSDLGFSDRRKGDRPNTRWSILKKLAEHGGRLEWNTNLTREEKNRLQTAIKDIRKRLQALTGLTDDPFHRYREKKAYETRFTILGSSNLDQPVATKADEDSAD